MIGKVRKKGKKKKRKRKRKEKEMRGLGRRENGKKKNMLDPRARVVYHPFRPPIQYHKNSIHTNKRLSLPTIKYNLIQPNIAPIRYLRTHHSSRSTKSTRGKGRKEKKYSTGSPEGLLI